MENKSNSQAPPPPGQVSESLPYMPICQQHKQRLLPLPGFFLNPLMACVAWTVRLPDGGGCGAAGREEGAPGGDDLARREGLH